MCRIRDYHLNHWWSTVRTWKWVRRAAEAAPDTLAWHAQHTEMIQPAFHRQFPAPASEVSPQVDWFDWSELNVARYRARIDWHRPAVRGELASLGGGSLGVS